MKNPTLAISHTVEREHTFLIAEESRYTYGDLSSFSTRFAEYLKKHKLSTDRPLGLHADSSDKLVFIIAACWMHNIPFTSFNPNAKLSTLAEQIEAVQPGLLITDDGNFSITDQCPVVSIDETEIPEIKSSDNSGKLPFTQYKHSLNKVFGYFFTSGTTGRSKIVPLKRCQVHAAAESSAANLKPAANQAWLLCMPLNHIGGISIILRSLIYGSAIYRLDDFDAGRIAPLISSNEHVVAASLVPTMLKRLLDNPHFTTHEAFKAILLGGGPIQTQLLNQCVDRNIPVIPSYGMTETCAQIAANPIIDKPVNPETLHSVGKIFSPNSIEIRDDENNAITTDESGTIWLKGPQVFDGYRYIPDSESFDVNGWFDTGDFGRLDRAGNLYIETRRTDLIITGGENVSPVEVEAALERLEPVKEAAVFGVPDEEWGQKIVAAIVFFEGQSSSEKNIRNLLRNELESFKIPKEVIAVNKLPRTATGKIKRPELSKFYQSK